MNEYILIMFSIFVFYISMLGIYDLINHRILIIFMIILQIIVELFFINYFYLDIPLVFINVLYYFMKDNKITAIRITDIYIIAYNFLITYYIGMLIAFDLFFIVYLVLTIIVLILTNQKTKRLAFIPIIMFSLLSILSINIIYDTTYLLVYVIILFILKLKIK